MGFVTSLSAEQTYFPVIVCFLNLCDQLLANEAVAQLCLVVYVCKYIHRSRGLIATNTPGKCDRDFRSA